jgi:Protein of unknown function (DUF3618)
VDQGTRAGGAALKGDRSPSEIRSDIENTREELGEVVEALAAKTDMKAQARAKVEDVKANPRKPLLIAGGIVAALVLLAILRRDDDD